MNKYYFIISMSVILVCCISNRQILTNDDKQSSFYPLIITNVESSFIEIKYKIVGYTKAIPPSVIKKIDSYIYQIDLTIQVNDKANWGNSFFIQILYLDGTSNIIEFNEEEYILIHGNLYNYIFDLEIKKHQEVKLVLGYIDESGQEVYDIDNPFRSKSLQLN